MKNKFFKLVKTNPWYYKTVEEIHHFLEGFGEDRVVIDQPRHFRRPKFRY